ncbi:MAG TPA: ABC transporter substrate-binding protein [Chloroflexota bacterium]|nr:ABC transporter substrate-binding protein [Chloroflexota bacterium]
MSQLSPRVSRRRLLRTASLAGVGALAIPLVNCGGSSTSKTPTVGTTAVPTTSSTGGAATASPAAAASAASQSAATPAKSQVLRYADSAGPRSIDPANALESNSLHVVRAAYEGLAADVFGTTQLKPHLATSWKVSTDATTYTFTLQQGVKFHDGTTMDATAVKKSYDRVIQMNLGPAGLLQDVDQVTVVDPSTVTITLKKPNVYFIAYVPKIGIVSPTAWQQHDKGGDMGAAWLEQNTAGTGPFKITQIRPNEAWVMDRFNDYWRGWSGNHLTQIQELVVPEVTTAVQMLEAGQLEYASSLGPDDYKHLQSVPGVTVHISKNYEIDIISLDVTKAPLTDVRVRQAFQYAFDYDGFLKNVLLGWGTIPTGPIAPGYPSFNPTLAPFKQDMAKAKQLLSEANVGNVSIDANFVSGNVREQQSATVLQSSLQQLGITLNLKALPWSTMFSLAGNAAQAMPLSNLLMSTFTSDPTFTLNQNYGCTFVGKPYNWSYYCSTQAQALIDQAQGTVDQQKSYGLLQQAQKLVLDDAPAIFYANPQAVDATSSKVQNYAWDPIDYYWQVDWYSIWLSQ